MKLRHDAGVNHPLPQMEILTHALDALSGIVYIYDLERRRNVYVSRSWGRDFGYTLQQTQADDGNLLGRIVHPDDLAAAIAHHASLRDATDDVSLKLEYRVRRADGEYVWLESVDHPLSRGKDGRVALIVGQAQEITARKKAESNRAKDEARFRTIVEHLPDAVFIADAAARILQVNDAACAQVGYTREELSRMRISDIVAPEYRTHVSERLSAPHGTASARQSAHQHKDGSIVAVETVVLSLELEGVPVFMGVARDISDRQRLEAKLRDAQRMESIGRLAGAVAHDFNNILSAIMGGASLLEGSANIHPADRALAKEIAAAATRGAELTRQLLTFGRRQRTRMEVVDVSARLEETLAVLRRLVDPSIAIETHLVAGCHVLVDPAMLDQVIMNLILNARDALPSGGVLQIAIAPDAADPSWIGMTFVDNGAGIDPTHLPHVFEPFFTTKPEGEGSGIGLATVYGIVTQHGGRITVESSTAVDVHGTTFRVVLPRSQATPSRDAGSSNARPVCPSLTILLVEDMGPVRAIIGQMLTHAGHRVLPAASAAEAREIWTARAGAVDLLLSDLSLGPGSDGRQLAHDLRRLRPELGVVLMSGFAPDAAEADAEERYDFMQKPFRLDELITLLRRREAP